MRTKAPSMYTKPLSLIFKVCIQTMKATTTTTPWVSQYLISSFKNKTDKSFTNNSLTFSPIKKMSTKHVRNL